MTDNPQPEANHSEQPIEEPRAKPRFNYSEPKNAEPNTEKSQPTSEDVSPSKAEKENSSAVTENGKKLSPATNDEWVDVQETEKAIEASVDEDFASERNDAETSSTEEEPAPPPQKYRYRVVMKLPEALQKQINNIVETAPLDNKNLVKTMQWQTFFQADDEQAMIDAINEWLTEQLPLTTKTEKVFSAVFGRQTYIAGWHLKDAEKISAAQQALTTKLASFIKIEATANTKFSPRLIVAANVDVDRFPTFVAALQNKFKATKWTMDTCELLRQPIDETGKPLPSKGWESAHQFAVEEKED